MKKQLSLILALLMLLPACSANPSPSSEGSDTTDSSGNTPVESTSAESTEEGIPADKLPADLSFDGETFRAFTRVKDFFHGEMVISETMGEMLNDARYDAVNAVEKRLDIVMKEEYYGIGQFTDNDSPRNLLMSGDSTYDIYNGRHVNMFNYAAEGLAQSINDMPYLDLSAVWWDEEFSNEVTLGNERYFALGAYNLTAYDSIHMLLFNKKLYTDLDIENNRLGGTSIYDVVKNGEWTMDLFNTTLTDVTADMDGDGKLTNQDRYAYVTPATQVMPSFLLGADQFMMKKDENNFLYNNMDGNQSFFNTYEKIMDMMWTNTNWFPTVANPNTEQTAEITNMFRMGQGLYCDSTGGNVSGYRDMEVEFGILPYPKLNESQKNYRSRSEYPELFVVPPVNNHLERTGAVLEALASEYYRSVRPVYFELSLKGRDTHDVESAEMLEIIYNNRVFDFGDTIFCTEIRDGQLRWRLANKEYDLASFLATIAPSLNQKLDNLNKGFGKK